MGTVPQPACRLHSATPHQGLAGPVASSDQTVEVVGFERPEQLRFLLKLRAPSGGSALCLGKEAIDLQRKEPHCPPLPAVTPTRPGRGASPAGLPPGAGPGAAFWAAELTATSFYNR